MFRHMLTVFYLGNELHVVGVGYLFRPLHCILVLIPAHTHYNSWANGFPLSQRYFFITFFFQMPNCNFNKRVLFLSVQIRINY